MTSGCEGKNKRGASCGMPVLQGERFCWAHSAKVGAARAKARKRGGGTRQQPAPSQLPEAPPQLRSVAAIQEQIERALFDVLHLGNSVQRSRRSLTYSR